MKKTTAGCTPSSTKGMKNSHQPVIEYSRLWRMAVDMFIVSPVWCTTCADQNQRMRWLPRWNQ